MWAINHFEIIIYCRCTWLWLIIASALVKCTCSISYNECSIHNRNVYIYVMNGALWDMEHMPSGICASYSNNFKTESIHCRTFDTYMPIQVFICICTYIPIRNIMMGHYLSETVVLWCELFNNSGLLFVTSLCAPSSHVSSETYKTTFLYEVLCHHIDQCNKF